MLTRRKSSSMGQMPCTMSASRGRDSVAIIAEMLNIEGNSRKEHPSGLFFFYT